MQQQRQQGLLQLRVMARSSTGIKPNTTMSITTYSAIASLQVILQDLWRELTGTATAGITAMLMVGAKLSSSCC
jgi:hypothetical protein